MSIFQRLARVRTARLRMRAARLAVSPSAAALLVRGRRHPLGTVSVAAGAGFVLGRLNVHPLRIPGFGALLGGGLAEAVAYGTRLIAELGPATFAAERRRESPADTRPAGDDAP